MKPYTSTVRFVRFLLLGLIVLVAAGCSDQTSSSSQQKSNADDKVPTLMLSFPSSNLDPSNDFTPIRAGITETLVKLGKNQQLKEGLSSGWKAESPTLWEFDIREGVEFHDGTKLTAKSVKSSLERSMEDNMALKSTLKIKSIQADGQRLTIETDKPHPALPSELVNPYTSIISTEAEKKAGKAKFNQSPVGTGPFMIQSFKPNEVVNVERFTNYWAGKPKVKQATIKFNEDANVRSLALQSGEADIAYNLAAESVDTLRKNEKLKVESIPGLRVHYLLYNQQEGPMKDIRVRQALDHLLDRRNAADEVMQGHAIPANGPFNSKLPFGNKEKVKAKNLDQAKKLLKEAGYIKSKNGSLMKDGTPLSLELVTYKGRPELPLIAQMLQSDATKAGVQLNIKMVEDPDSYLQKQKDWDIATYSNLSAPRGDGAFFISSTLMSGGALNPTHYEHKELNKIIGKLNGTLKTEDRFAVTEQAVTLINEQVPHSYAVYPNVIVGLNKQITGWEPGSEEYYMLTHQMDVK